MLTRDTVHMTQSDQDSQAPMARTILVVDDKRELRNMVKAYLTQEGFQVTTAGDGREAIFAAREANPDLIVLDLMMPDMGGYEFLRVWSREADTPVIILTAKLDEQDKVLGLELGADDYVTKPFSLRELTARIRAVLRRLEKAQTTADVLTIGDIRLDSARHTVTIQDERVDLTPTEFGLLQAFMRAPGRVFSRLDLLESLQGDAYEGYERTIDVHIRNLRTKIEPNPKSPVYIETVYGVGYRFSDR